MRVKTVNEVIENKIISKSVGHACAFKIASYELSEILAQLIETKFDELEEDDSDYEIDDELQKKIEEENIHYD